MSHSQRSRSIGINTLLKDERDSTPTHIADAAEKSFDGIPGGKLIPLDRIDTWEGQPRKSFDKDGIKELATSIASSGVLEPLVVRRHSGQPGRYIIIAGHRRLLAARQVHESEDADERARVGTLPCVIREATDATAFADALVENLVRTDLTRREMMDAVKVLQDEYKWSVREIARRTGRNQHDLSVLARIAADNDLSQLVADDIISPTALGMLVEKRYRSVRGAVIAQIRAGDLKTVSDVEEATLTALAALHAPSQADEVSDITHPATPSPAPPDAPHGHIDVSDITHPSEPRDIVSDDSDASTDDEVAGRTTPVQAHERRVAPPTDTSARFERVLADSMAAIRACLPVGEADQTKARAFVSEVLTLIEAVGERPE